MPEAKKSKSIKKKSKINVIKRKKYLWMFSVGSNHFRPVEPSWHHVDLDCKEFCCSTSQYSRVHLRIKIFYDNVPSKRFLSNHFSVSVK